MATKKTSNELKLMKARATLNDKYQTAKWEARKSHQARKDSIRNFLNQPRKPFKFPF